MPGWWPLNMQTLKEWRDWHWLQVCTSHTEYHLYLKSSQLNHCTDFRVISIYLNILAYLFRVVLWIQKRIWYCCTIYKDWSQLIERSVTIYKIVILFIASANDIENNENNIFKRFKRGYIFKNDNIHYICPSAPLILFYSQTEVLVIQTDSLDTTILKCIKLLLCNCLLKTCVFLRVTKLTDMYTCLKLFTMKTLKTIYFYIFK